MVGFESSGIELLWRRSALSECSCLICNQPIKHTDLEVRLYNFAYMITTIYLQLLVTDIVLFDPITCIRIVPYSPQ